MSGWRKPKKCGSHGSCVEVRALDRDHAQLRSSQKPSRCMTVTRAELAAFIDAVKAGEYDDLT